MKLLIGSFVFIFFISVAKSQPLGLDDIRNKALLNIRTLRNTINKNNINSTSVDSLQKTLSIIINATKTVEDIQQLNIISYYFQLQNEIISSNNYFKNIDSSSSKIREINQDLLFKISKSSDKTLNLEGGFNFGHEKEISVTAYINGKKQDTGLYRLYWSPFRGGSLDFLIKNNSYMGSSNNFSNPYKIKIILPANYITFWLIDTQTNLIYKPDTPYKSLIEIESSVDILFKK